MACEPMKKQKYTYTKIHPIFSFARIHPDYIASILSGRELTESELERVANYLLIFTGV